MFATALRPTIRFVRARRNGRRYRGSMELTDNCSAAIWENGRHVRAARSSRISPGWGRSDADLRAVSCLAASEFRALLYLAVGHASDCI